MTCQVMSLSVLLSRATTVGCATRKNNILYTAAGAVGKHILTVTSLPVPLAHSGLFPLLNITRLPVRHK